MRKFSSEEQETIITYNQHDKEASVYTCDPKLICKLDKLVEEYDEYFKIRGDEDEAGVWGEYTLPKKRVKINAPRASNLTDEQREAAGARLAKYRGQQSSEDSHIN